MPELLEQPAFLLSIVALIGLLIGSLLNVVIYRLPIMMAHAWRRECREFLEQPLTKETAISLALPNSHCPHCSAPIRAWQNIPVLSFILLRGRCASCRAAISLRYPAIELITGALSLAAGTHFGFESMEIVGALIMIWCLIALTWIDIDTQLLPDSITLPLLWLGLLFNLNDLFTDITSAVVGAVAGYLTLWSVYWGFKLLSGKEGMGYGDFKLLAALGAWFGWQALPLIILLSSFVGALIGIILIVAGRQGREVHMPFGPYLAGAGLLCLFFGDTLISQYFNIVGM